MNQQLPDDLESEFDSILSEAKALK